MAVARGKGHGKLPSQRSRHDSSMNGVEKSESQRDRKVMVAGTLGNDERKRVKSRTPFTQTLRDFRNTYASNCYNLPPCIAMRVSA